MAIKPSIPKGTRDFTPEEMLRRGYIFDTIKRVFEKYAFLPVATPSMENLSTLMGKYGEEGDRLIFKILNSGDFTRGANLQDAPVHLAGQICEKGLRYDLTVPFARFVVMHQHELTFPFKRYQMQPVWRADRPQKGRYREFYQCDADIIGSNSLFNEAELLKITDDIFEKLGIRVSIKVNNRKILSGIAEYIGAADKTLDICTAMDKLDKIGYENVVSELYEKGLSPECVNKLAPVCLMKGSNEEKLLQLKSLFEPGSTGSLGVEEIETVLHYAKQLEVLSEIEIDVSLARGLNYYTGAIFEVRALNTAMGSISGGGRYDDLTGVFGLKNLSGVGISYGAERIYDVMDTLNLFPASISAPVKALFLNFGEAEVRYAIPVLQRLRDKGIACELYPDTAKLGKQLNYANAKHIPFVIMAGEEEMKENLFTLKDMESGNQEKMNVEDILEKLWKAL
ncbi:MAG: histidine--tRNA ligase [Bacteroidales bacterium]|jgi:histidyl-tRNA synthetase|nr:histidine--tRNA ligase [Bacteroidales bacterium]